MPLRGHAIDAIRQTENLLSWSDVTVTGAFLLSHFTEHEFHRQDGQKQREGRGTSWQDLCHHFRGRLSIRNGPIWPAPRK